MEGQMLHLWIVVAAIALMVGGKGAFGAVIKAPLAWGGKLLADLLKGTMKLVLDLAGNILRGTFRLANRGVRHVARLPPPQRPQRRRPASRRDDEDCEDD